MKKEDYETVMTAWTDEAGELCDGFKSLFPDTTEGHMKYLFALNYMMLMECFERKIPDSSFGDFVRALIGAWFMAGKPEGVEILHISADSISDLVERVKKMQEDAGGKPSSDG